MAASSRLRPALNTGSQRLFFALWPDAGHRAEISAVAKRMHRVLHGRRTRDDSIHLTLAFIGEVGADRFGSLLTPPESMLTSTFVLTLDQWGCWPRNGIGWLAPSRTPDGLRDLAANLASWLRGAGFELESRAFIPHVTLIRNATCAPLPEILSPVCWPVNELNLIRSQRMPGGSRYDVLRTWPLRGRA